jgi:hypothetical protein
MKATLEYILPEEEYAFHGAIKGEVWRSIMQDLDEQMRSVIKYGKDKVKAKHAQEWRDRLNQLIKDNDLFFYG